ncbi:MAG: hypothetical protein L6V82_00425 [Clostridiales bacterium]|nr:MAG: hypothetical protein L6V82_00425 [Clostridiales bacterium]
MQRKILLFVVDFRDLLKKRREKRGETQRALRKPPEKITIPENSIVSAFLSVANVYGYADASFIAPDEKPQYRH